MHSLLLKRDIDLDRHRVRVSLKYYSCVSVGGSLIENEINVGGENRGARFSPLARVVSGQDFPFADRLAGKYEKWNGPWRIFLDSVTRSTVIDLFRVASFLSEGPLLFSGPTQRPAYFIPD